MNKTRRKKTTERIKERGQLSTRIDLDKDAMDLIDAVAAAYNLSGRKPVVEMLLSRLAKHDRGKEIINELFQTKL